MHLECCYYHEVGTYSLFFNCKKINASLYIPQKIWMTVLMSF